MSSPIEEIRQLENDWYDAVKNRKRDVLENILADEYTNTNADGHVWRKKEGIDHCCKGGPPRYVVYEFKDVEIDDPIVYADRFAVVRGSDEVKATFDGNPAPVTGRFRWTDLWVKTDSGWRCVASHCCKWL